MPQYILLLKGVNENLHGKSPGELQKLFETYDAWVENIHRQDKLRAAQKLKDAVRHSVTVQNGRTVDGPFTETKETIGGYFLVETAGLQDAVELARKCPVLTHGGSVEVREIHTEACRYSHLTGAQRPVQNSR